MAIAREGILIFCLYVGFVMLKTLTIPHQRLLTIQVISEHFGA